VRVCSGCAKYISISTVECIWSRLICVSTAVIPSFCLLGVLRLTLCWIHLARLPAAAFCENIRDGYLYDGDLVFVILKGIYGFKFPKRFLEISSRDLTSSFFF
jgi:hypothetical protein